MRRPIRVLISDIEGCVVPAGPAPWSLRALTRLAGLAAAGEAGRGPRLALSSGRPAQFVEAVARMLGLETPALAENGAVLVEPRTGRTRVLYTREQARLMAEVRRFCERAFAADGGVHVPAGRELGVALVLEPGRRDEAEDLCEAVTRRLAGEAGLPVEELRISWNAGSVDITPRGIDKGTGLRMLLEELGLDPGEVMAVGDGGNDLPMFEVAGWRGAPANALPAVKALADRVASRPDTAGVIELMRWAARPSGTR